MDKIILAYYINVGNLDSSDVKHVVDLYREQVKDPSMIQYFIPIRDGETRVDCVYPKFVVGEQVDSEMKGVLERLNNHVKNIENGK